MSTARPIPNLIGVLLIVMAAVSCRARSDMSAIASVRTDTLSLQTFFRDLRTVAGRVNGETGSWLFDTGGGVTLITPEVARRAGCVPSGHAVGVRMSGEAVHFQWCSGVRLEFGSGMLAPTRVAVFDVNALLPEPLRTLSGVLSLDALAGRYVTIDWPGSRVVVATTPGASTGVVLALRTATGPDGTQLTVFTPVVVGGDTLWMLLDSGDIEGTILGPRALSIVNVREGFEQFLSVPSVAGPRMLRIVSKPILYDGVLGTEYLQLGPVILDLTGGAGGMRVIRAR